MGKVKPKAMERSWAILMKPRDGGLRFLVTSSGAPYLFGGKEAARRYKRYYAGYSHATNWAVVRVSVTEL